MPWYMKALFGFCLLAALLDIVAQWPPSGVTAAFRMVNLPIWIVATWLWCVATYGWKEASNGWKDLYDRFLRRGGNTPDDRM